MTKTKNILLITDYGNDSDYVEERRDCFSKCLAGDNDFFVEINNIQDEKAYFSYAEF